MTRVNKTVCVCALFVLSAFAVVFAICAIPHTAYAAGATNPAGAAGPNITVSTQPTGTAGEYVAAVSVTGNPGISVYNLALEFDNDRLTPISIAQGDALTNGMVFASNLTQAKTDEAKAQLDQVTAVWGAPEDARGDGTLFSVTFRANTSTGERTPIELTVNRIIGAEQDLPAVSAGTELAITPAGGDTGSGGEIEADPAATGDDASASATADGDAETTVDSGFIGAPYELDDTGTATVGENIVPAAANSSFGRPPQTGMPDITWAVAAACVSLAAYIASGVYLILYCRKKKRIGHGRS